MALALRGAPLGCSPAFAGLSSSPKPRAVRVSRAVLAMASPKPSKPSTGEALDNFLQRYSNDFLSAGVGAFACTSFFVSQGQDPWTALSITAAATVTALVANELMFDKDL